MVKVGIKILIAETADAGHGAGLQVAGTSDAKRIELGYQVSNQLPDAPVVFRLQVGIEVH